MDLYADSTQPSYYDNSTNSPQGEIDSLPSNGKSGPMTFTLDKIAILQLTTDKSAYVAGDTITVTARTNCNEGTVAFTYYEETKTVSVSGSTASCTFTARADPLTGILNQNILAAQTLDAGNTSKNFFTYNFTVYEVIASNATYNGGVQSVVTISSNTTDSPIRWRVRGETAYKQAAKVSNNFYVSVISLRSAGTYTIEYYVEAHRAGIGAYSTFFNALGSAGNPRTVTVTVAPAELTVDPSKITVIPREYDGTKFAEITVPDEAVSGKFNGDSITVTGTATLASADAGSDIAVTDVSFAVTGEDGACYTVAPITTIPSDLRGTITPRQLTATVTASDMQYNGSNLATVTAAVDTGVSGESFTISGLTGTFSQYEVGENLTVTLDKRNVEINSTTAKLSNYSITFPQTTIASIRPAAMTVTVSQQNTLTYTGEPLTPEVNISSTLNPTVTYRLSENESYGALPSFTDAGDYTVYYKAECSNYETVYGSFTVTVNQADNSWITEPSISSWTYGSEANLPSMGSTRFGEVSLHYEGTAKDGTTWNSSQPPVKAGLYEAVFSVAETTNYKEVSYIVPFVVYRAVYDMSGAAWDYTEPFEYDGKPHGVTVTGLPAGVTLQSITGDAEAVSVGDYLAEPVFSYDAYNFTEPYLTGLYWSISNTWEPTEYTVSPAGWTNGTVTVTAAEGYAVSAGNADDSLWESTLTLDGETALEGGTAVFYLRELSTEKISRAGEAEYFIDLTAPTGSVGFEGRSPWTEFLHAITFGLLFKDSQRLVITGEDALSGIGRLEYLVSETSLSQAEVISSENWQVYSAPVLLTAEDAKQFVYYARITDNAGNVTYLSTDGIEFDTSAPVIGGVEDGAVCYTTRNVTVSDPNLLSVTLNGSAAEASLTLPGNIDAEYVIEAQDKLGNSATVTVRMCPISRLAEELQGITEDNVTSDDEDAILDVQAALRQEDAEAASEEEKALLDTLNDTCNALLDVLDAAVDAVNTESVAETLDTTENTVLPDEKEDLLQAREDLEAALEEYGSNFTGQETEALEDALQRIENALAALENTEAAEELLSALPETASPDDAAAREAYAAAKTAYDALTEHEQSIVAAALAERLNALGEALKAYRILEGDGTRRTQGDITIKANGPYADFLGLQVDGALLDPAYYTASSGSTVATLRAGYLDTLSSGRHTVTFLYPDGTAEATIHLLSADSPSTGDRAHLALWTAALLLSLAAGSVLYLLCRKKRS